MNSLTSAFRADARAEDASTTTAGENASLLVLGIGNSLLCDDGVGIHVIRALRVDPRLPGHVTVLDGGTLSFTLAPIVATARRLIIVDAADLDAPAGTVRLYVGDAMDERLGRARRSSVHEVSLFDLMAISKLSGDWPEQRALVGVQPGLVGWGEAPSEAVQHAIPVACQRVLDLARQWG